MTGFYAVHVRVEPQELVAVALRDVVVAVFALRIQLVVLGILADQGEGEQREIARRRIVSAVGQSARIREIRARHAEAPGLAVHAFHERRFRACEGFGESDAGIVARLDDQPVQQLFDRDRPARLDEHARTGRAPCALRDADRLTEGERPALERRESEVRGHELGERSRLDALLRIAARDRLSAGCVEEQPGARIHHGRLRRGGERDAGKQQRKAGGETT